MGPFNNKKFPKPRTNIIKRKVLFVLNSGRGREDLRLVCVVTKEDAGLIWKFNLFIAVGAVVMESDGHKRCGGQTLCLCCVKLEDGCFKSMFNETLKR